MAYSTATWAYKDPLTTQKLGQMNDNSVFANEHGIFGVNLSSTGSSTVEIAGGRMAIGNAWLQENVETVASLTAENNAHWEEGTTQEGSSTAWYVVAKQSGVGYNCLFRNSAPAYSDVTSGTSTGPKIYDKTGSTWYRYIGEVYNNSASNIEQSTVAHIPSFSVAEKTLFEGDALTGLQTAIPGEGDDTIPQIGEGDQVLEMSYTPKNKHNKLIIDVKVCGFLRSSASSHVMALFKVGTNDALCTVQQYTAINGAFTQTLRYIMVAGATGEITFTVRIGNSSSFTEDFNCSQGGQRGYGGSMGSYISVEEIGR